MTNAQRIAELAVLAHYALPEAPAHDSRTTRSDDSVVRITFGAAPNQRKGCGWLPFITVNGRHQGNTWQAHGYDRDEALELARLDAHEEADHFIGDWDITIEPAE